MGPIRIAFMDPGHRSAEMYAKYINADIYTIKFRNRFLRLIDAIIKAAKIPKNSYNIILCGTIEAMFFCFIRKIIHPDEEVIYISRINDERFNIKNPLKQHFVLFIAKYTDAFIAISKRVSNFIRSNINYKNILIINNFVIKDSFFNTQPNLRSNNILVVGRYKKMKGIDIALKIFNNINFDSELYIVGLNKNELNKELKILENDKKQRVHIMGYVENWEEIAKKCKFYLHPGRGDAGGNSVLESMAIGLIPIVSSCVGNKEFVEKVNSNLVVNSLDPDEYVKVLNKLANEDIKNLKKISHKCKKIAISRKKDSGLREFKNKLCELVKNFFQFSS